MHILKTLIHSVLQAVLAGNGTQNFFNPVRALTCRKCQHFEFEGRSECDLSLSLTPDPMEGRLDILQATEIRTQPWGGRLEKRGFSSAVPPSPLTPSKEPETRCWGSVGSSQ